MAATPASLADQYEKIRDIRLDLESAESAFLRFAGWRYTSEVGSLGLWTKEVEGKTVYLAASTAIWLEARDLPAGEVGHAE